MLQNRVIPYVFVCRWIEQASTLSSCKALLVLRPDEVFSKFNLRRLVTEQQKRRLCVVHAYCIIFLLPLELHPQATCRAVERCEQNQIVCIPALHCIVLHSITMHYIALHCIALHWIALQHFGIGKL